MNPYRNLAAFTEQDAPFYFGRETEITQLLQRLRGAPRFLVISAPSGSGKSSLVQAGLLPRLRKGALPRSESWKITLTRPTDDAFVPHLQEASEATEPEILIIDQFEELFLSSDETFPGKIIDKLARLLDHAPQLILLLVLRSDFYNRLASYEYMHQHVEQAVIPLALEIQHADIEAMVREPAKAVGWSFEEGLVELIVNDMRAMQAGAETANRSTHLPLLEFALTQLWEACQEEGVLTRAAYHNIGGVTGSLAFWAQQTYTSFETSQRSLVDHIFTALVYPGDAERRIPDMCYRRNLSELVRRQDSQEDLEQIIYALVKKHLLVIGQAGPDQPVKVEIIHDTLL